MFGAVIGGNALNYLYYMQLGRVLSVANYGAVMSLVSLMLLSFSVAAVLQTIIAKLAADIRAAGDEKGVATLSRAISRFALAAGAAVALVCLASQQIIARYLHIENPWLIDVACVSAGLGLIIICQRGLFQGLGHFKAFGISSMTDGLKAILVVPLTLASGVVGSLLALFVGYVATATYGAAMARRSYRGASHNAHLDVRRMFLTAGMTGFPTFAITVLMFYDVVLARHFLDPVDAGLYGAAALSGRVVFTLIAFLPTILLPHVAHGSAQGRSQTRLLFLALCGAALLIAPTALIALFVPQLVIKVLAGAKFLSADSLVLPYVLAAGALAIANVLSVYAIACHRFRFVPYVVVISVCEIVLVSLRHGSAMDIATDILAGHVGVLCVLAISTTWDTVRARAPVVEARTA